LYRLQRGDRIFNSLYQIQMRLDEQCKVVCKVNSLSEEQVAKIKESVVGLRTLESS
jgi:transmembrane 9 superfamily protein 2/4